jgi:hypothetical protein
MSVLYLAVSSYVLAASSEYSVETEIQQHEQTIGKPSFILQAGKPVSVEVASTADGEGYRLEVELRRDSPFDGSELWLSMRFYEKRDGNYILKHQPGMAFELDEDLSMSIRSIDENTGLERSEFSIRVRAVSLLPDEAEGAKESTQTSSLQKSNSDLLR